MIRTYKALSNSDADMDNNDFFIIRHASDVSRLLKESHLDQTIIDLLKEEGVKHSPPIGTNRVRANPMTKGCSRQQKSKQTTLGQTVGVASSSQEAETLVDKAHTGRKHVTYQDRPSAAENPFKKPLPASQIPSVPLSTDIATVSNSKELEFPEIESIIQEIVAAKSIAFTVNKKASKLQCQQIAKSMKQSNAMTAVIPQSQFHTINPDRKCVLATSILKYFEKNIAEIMKFAKRIPGFTDLPIDDQANLIRGARIECDTISGIVIDPDSMITMSEDGEWFNQEDIATMFSIDFWMEHSKMSRKIDQMKMTKEEVAILKALTVISPDRCIIAETSQVSKIQDTLLRCLSYQVSKSYKRSAVRLGQLFALLTSLRSITEAGTKEIKKMFIEFPSMTKGSVTEEVMDEQI